jgi:3-deoxy-D-manno-octulosonic-acid transferase
MRLLLDLIYLVAFTLLSPWILYRSAKTGNWRTIPRRFGAGLGEPLDDCILLHASSVGEVSVLKQLIGLLETEAPDQSLVISTYTSAGLDAARAAFPRHRVIVFPFDLSFVVNRFLRHLNPHLIIVVESEFWPNFLLGAAARRIPVALLNGKMSAKSCRRYAKTGFVPRALRGLGVVAVQTAEHAERMRSLGVDAARLFVTGNMKYDSSQTGDPDELRRHRRALGYADDDVVIIGGSLHEPEDRDIADAFEDVAAAGVAAALIVAPRYPADAARIGQRLKARGRDFVLKSDVDAGRTAPGRSAVLVVDRLGELRQLYGVSDIAFVGGSMYYRGSNKGGHNVMEPAVLGTPVVVGPYNYSFRETVDDLAAAGAALVVRDGGALRAALGGLAADPDRWREMGRRARRVVLDGQGATERNYRLIAGLVDAEPQLQGNAPDRTMRRPASDPTYR